MFAFRARSLLSRTRSNLGVLKEFIYLGFEDLLYGYYSRRIAVTDLRLRKLYGGRCDRVVSTIKVKEFDYSRAS